MRRKCIDSLNHWKKSSILKPLILQGLRQTGKTWLLMEFGNKQYENTLYINLETDQPAASYLSVPRDPQEALLFLETYADKPLRPSSSLLILDNIQCVPQISTLLPAIAADFPQYHITAIVRSMENSSSYSPHDFELLTLYPLDFEEFLWANAEFALAREIRAHSAAFEPMGKKLHEKALSQFRLYQIIGGMPASILEYKKEKKLLMVPDTQQKLLDLFLNDITALAPRGTARYCRNSWLSIPSQIGRTSRKFQYTRIAKGATAKTYQEPLQWLIRSGLVLSCNNISHTFTHRSFKSNALNPTNSLSSNTQTTNVSTQDTLLTSETCKQQISLHLYPIDTGLCTRILQIPSYQLLTGEESIANTACTETFLAQQFVQNGYTLSYWSSGNQAEVPFILCRNNHLTAVDYRITPHQKCRSLMQLYHALSRSDSNYTNQTDHPTDNTQNNSLPSTPNSLPQIEQMYLLSVEDFKVKEHYKIIPVYAAFCI